MKPKYPSAKQFMATAAASLAFSAASCQQSFYQTTGVPMAAHQKDEPVNIQEEAACKKAAPAAKSSKPPQKAQ